MGTSKDMQRYNRGNKINKLDKEQGDEKRKGENREREKRKI